MKFRRKSSASADIKMSDDEASEGPSGRIAFWKDYQFWNTLGVSVAFMILFSAFHTCGMLQVKYWDRNYKHVKYINFQHSVVSGFCYIYISLRLNRWYIFRHRSSARFTMNTLTEPGKRDTTAQLQFTVSKKIQKYLFYVLFKYIYFYRNNLTCSQLRKTIQSDS